MGVSGKGLTPPAKSCLTLTMERVLSPSLPPHVFPPPQVMGRPAKPPELWLDIFWCNWRGLLHPAPWTAPAPQSRFPLGSWLFQRLLSEARIQRCYCIDSPPLEFCIFTEGLPRLPGTQTASSGVLMCPLDIPGLASDHITPTC